MPLNLNFAPVGSVTRKRLEDPNRTQADIYGQTDPTQALGRAPLSGVESALAGQVSKLNFDPTAERLARLDQINRNAQTAKTELGNQFVLTPGGTSTAGLQGGNQQRQFETFQTGLLNTKDQLEAELSQRAQAENRANVAALQGIQQGVEQAALNAEQVNLQAVGQGLQAQGQGFTQGLQAGGLTGSYNGKDTLASKAQTFGQKVAEAGVTGTYDKSPTLDSKRLDLQTAETFGKSGPIGAGTATAQASQAGTGLAISAGQAAGQVPLLNPDGTPRLDASGKPMYSSTVQAGAQAGAVPLFNTDGTPAIDPATGTQRTGTTIEAQQLGLQTATTFGKSGPIASGTMTEEARRNQALETLQGRGLDINEANLASQIQIDQARAAGKAWDPSKEAWVQSVESRQAESDISYKSGMLAEETNARQKRNQLEFATLTGLVRDPLTDTTVKTMAQKELDQRKTLADNDLKLQRDMAEADRIGQMNGKDTVEYKKALQTIAESKARVEQAWTDLTGEYPGDTSPLKGTKTVAQQQLDITSKNAALQRAIDQGRATGSFVDPITNKDYTTLEAEISRGQLAVQKSQQEATERANIYQMTGRAPLIGADGKVAIDRGTGQPIMMDTLENRIKTGELALSQANTYGQSILIDPKTGAVQYTTDGKGNIVPITQRSISADIALRQMTDQERRTSGQEIERFGGFTDPKTLKFYPTMEFQRMTADQKLNYQKLALESRTQADNAKAAWAQITGVSSGKPGTIGVSDFRQAMADNQSGKPFDITADINGDGKVDNDDMFIGFENGTVVPDNQAPVPTLAAKTLDASIKQAASSLGLEQSRLTQTMALSRDQLNQQVSQFKSNFGGVLVDDKGNPAWTWKAVDPVEQGKLVQDYQNQIGDLRSKEATAFSNGDWKAVTQYQDARKSIENQIASIQKDGGMWQQPTALEQQQFAENVREYNKNVELTLEQFYKRLGLDKETLDATQRASILNAFTQGLVGIYQAQASKGNTQTSGKTAGTVTTGTGPGGQYSDPNAGNQNQPFFKFGPISISDKNAKTDIVEIPHGLNMSAVIKSDKASKSDFKGITHEGVLDKVARMPVSTWRYKGDKTTHIGPMAQDFKKAFKVGSSDKVIHVVDAIGVNLSAVKALNEKVKRLEKRVG